MFGVLCCLLCLVPCVWCSLLFVVWGVVFGVLCCLFVVRAVVCYVWCSLPFDDAVDRVDLSVVALCLVFSVVVCCVGCCVWCS